MANTTTAKTELKTVIHHYWYNLDDYDKAKAEQDRKAYAELCDRMKAQGVKCFETWGNGSHYAGGDDGLTLTLETEHLYNNQWNATTPDGRGLRVFDWAQDYPAGDLTNPNIKRGHWLEITDEMTTARKDRRACGYCGKQEHKSTAPKFCSHCIGSEYLKETELHLLRMMPLYGESFPNRKPLTEAESAELLPIYNRAQGLGKVAREDAALSKRRREIAGLVEKAKAKGAELLAAAKVETEAYAYLMDNGWRDIENVIYYTHTGRFGFGWREPIREAELSKLLDIMPDFPYPYEIKTADGRKLEARL